MAFNRYHPWEPPELVDWDEDFDRGSSPRCLPLGALGIAAVGVVALCRPRRHCRPRCCSPRRSCYPRTYCYPYGCYPFNSCTPTFSCYPQIY
ncbi:MAG TPA: hypothetical protein PKA10_09365 [Selenomonadales bacterium]|nr:hypothetical protein [Selenomonadales bacterium]